MSHFLFFLFLLFSAVVFALIEIQIEGADGWAKNLPTWKLQNKWTWLLLKNKPLTGYHLYIGIFMLLFAHFPYVFFNILPSLKTELRTLSFILLFWMLEDFAWFILNKDYGIKKFKKEHIPWHADSWIWFAPGMYWIFIPSGVLCYILSCFI